MAVDPTSYTDVFNSQNPGSGLGMYIDSRGILRYSYGGQPKTASNKTSVYGETSKLSYPTPAQDYGQPKSGTSNGTNQYPLNGSGGDSNNGPGAAQQIGTMGGVMAGASLAKFGVQSAVGSAASGAFISTPDPMGFWSTMFNTQAHQAAKAASQQAASQSAAQAGTSGIGTSGAPIGEAFNSPVHMANDFDAAANGVNAAQGGQTATPAASAGAQPGTYAAAAPMLSIMAAGKALYDYNINAQKAKSGRLDTPDNHPSFGFGIKDGQIYTSNIVGPNTPTDMMRQAQEGLTAVTPALNDILATFGKGGNWYSAGGTTKEQLFGSFALRNIGRLGGDQLGLTGQYDIGPTMEIAKKHGLNLAEVAQQIVPHQVPGGQDIGDQGRALQQQLVPYLQQAVNPQTREPLYEQFQGWTGNEFDPSETTTRWRRISDGGIMPLNWFGDAYSGQSEGDGGEGSGANSGVGDPGTDASTAGSASGVM